MFTGSPHHTYASAFLQHSMSTSTSAFRHLLLLLLLLDAVVVVVVLLRTQFAALPRFERSEGVALIVACRAGGGCGAVAKGAATVGRLEILVRRQRFGRGAAGVHLPRELLDVHAACSTARSMG
eukprot:5509291-Prymnesium_polylepis.1